MTLPWIIALSAFVALLAVTAAVPVLFRESRKAMALDRRLQAVRANALSAYGEVDAHGERATDALAYAGSLVVAGALHVLAMLAPIGASERASLGNLLRQAGFRQRDALAVFLSFKMILMLAAGIAAGFMATGAELNLLAVQLSGGHPVVIGFAGLAGAVMGGLLPEMALRQLWARRRLRLATSLPDSFDLMVMCVEAGYTFERALLMVSQQLQPLAPDLAQELASVEAELRLGADRRAVLRDLYKRTGADGLRDFAMTVIQGERYGTPLSHSLQNIAHGERVQRAARLEAQAGRLPVMMSLPMLLLVVPGILILMGGPAYMMALNSLRAMAGN